MLFSGIFNSSVLVRTSSIYWPVGDYEQPYFTPHSNGDASKATVCTVGSYKKRFFRFKKFYYVLLLCSFVCFYMNKFAYYQVPIQLYWDSHFFFPFHNYLFHRFNSFIYGSILNTFNLKSFWWCTLICTLWLVNFSSSFDCLAVFHVNDPRSLWAESYFFLSLFPLPPLWPPPGPPLLVCILVFSWQPWSSFPILWVLQT